MIKKIFLIRGIKTESYSDFKSRVWQEVQNLNTLAQIKSLSFAISSKKRPLISIIPFSKKKMASVSVYLEEPFDLPSLSQMEGFVGSYLVTEALPVAYQKTWPLGSKTPGACLLTLFRSKKDISYETFIDRWHHGHTPLSLKYHPLWHYSRNVVDDRFPEQAEPWLGIVEEHTQTRSELLNPFKFFGKPWVIFQRMLMVYKDTKSFIDYRSMETYLAEEYHVK